MIRIFGYGRDMTSKKIVRPVAGFKINNTATTNFDTSYKFVTMPIKINRAALSSQEQCVEMKG
jgi:hypothetical protein